MASSKIHPVFKARCVERAHKKSVLAPMADESGWCTNETMLSVDSGMGWSSLCIRCVHYYHPASSAVADLVRNVEDREWLERCLDILDASPGTHESDTMNERYRETRAIVASRLATL